MRTVMHIGSVAIAAVFALALVIDAADARRGGGGGGMRAGGMGGGGMRTGGMGGRAGMAGGGRAHVSQPIARPGGGVGPGGGGNWANRPGGGGNWAGRPGYRPGYPGYRPGYGWGAAAAAGAIGAGLAYGSYYGGGYGGYYEEPAYTYPSYSYEAAGAQESDGDLIAECARRFKTYDVASQTYIKSKGVRASCP